MKHKDGDVFNTTATYIGHGINCVGLMGAGIAKTVREKYPQVYKEYKYLCDTDRLSPGTFFAYPVGDGKVIVNLTTQQKPGANAQYNHVFNALYTFSKQASDSNRIARSGKVIAIPEIGCGIGGLDLNMVYDIITFVERVFPEIEYEMWHYGG
jgi:O-acetyl-ADP-ribose deacetylase (regulator of RNase III)